MLSSFAATDAADTVLMRLVLLSSWTWLRTHHGPNRTGRGGRTAAIKFYELRDNLPLGGADRLLMRPAVRRPGRRRRSRTDTSRARTPHTKRGSMSHWGQIRHRRRPASRRARAT